MARTARLNRIWGNTISFTNQFKLYKSLVTFILLYGCETWTLLADSEKGIQAFETKCLRKFPCISYLEHKTNGWINFLLGQQDQLPFGSAETFSGNCCETETCMVWACHTSRQPLQKHPSGHLGGWATLWSAEEMLEGQHQRVDMPAHARTAHNGLLQKTLEDNIC